jgi:YNFM family putative membrane transporter
MGVFVSIYNYAGFLLSASPYGLSQLQISHIFYAYLLGTAASPIAGGWPTGWAAGRCWSLALC